MVAGSLLALEATLGALSKRPGDNSDAPELIRSAIGLVRAALADLQGNAEAGLSSQLALGFVMRPPRRSRPSDGSA
jgi:hypothetical protein